MIKKLLIAGCLVWLPIIATVWVITFIVELLDELLLLLPSSAQTEHWVGLHVPGFGVLLAVAIVLLTGLLVTNFLGNKLIEWWDAALKKIPLIGTLYSTFKQVIQTVVASDGESFRKVLMVEYPRTGVWSIGFQTAEIVGELNQAVDENLVCVFIPSTPNPTSGFLTLVPKEQVKELDISVEQAFKMLVSLGTVKADTPPESV